MAERRVGRIGKFANQMNNITSIAQNVRSSLDKFNGIFSSDTTNSSIRDRYTNGFYGDTTQFRPKVFSRLFDEPTYLTFRIEFNFYNDDKIKDPRIANSTYVTNTGYGWESLDYMPEPLLCMTKEINNNKTGKLREGEVIDESESKIANQKEQFSRSLDFYSTYNYLAYALGETQRAHMLSRFINALEDIQENYPYYFTGVEGLNSLSMVRPEKGIRLDDDNNTITITCMEGLDLKITQLMQLYRKIAWDDVYQRWVLPDMMRFFNMKIYVSEIRLFHTMSKSSSAKSVGRVFDLDSNSLNATSYDKIGYGKSLFGIANNVVNTALGMSDAIFGPGSGASRLLSDIDAGVNGVESILGALKGNMKLCDNAINDVMPTIVYDCKMCEFDISDTLEHISSLSSSKEGLRSPAPSIKIKVGKLYEHMYFPLSIGLKNDGKKYNLSNRNDILQFVFDDELLKDSGTRYFSESLYKNRLDKISETTKRRRMHKAFGNVEGDKDLEAYDPFSPDKTTSLISLAGGVAGFFSKDLHDSEAIDSERVERIKNLYVTNEDLHKSEAIISGESKPNVNPEELYNPTPTTGPALIDASVGMYGSSAVTIGQRDHDVNPEEVFNPTPTDSSALIDASVGMYGSSAVILGEKSPDVNPEEVFNPTPTTGPALIDASVGMYGSSAAILGEQELGVNPEKLHNSEAVAAGEAKPNIKPESLYKSEAVTIGENKSDIIPEKLHESKAVTSGESKLNIIPKKLHNSEAVTVGELIPNIKPEKLRSSEAVTAGEAKPNIEPAPLHQSTATTQEREIQQIINEEGEENVLSAATSIKKLIKYIEENNIIKSVATDDENNKELMKSIVFENAIDTLSTATDKEATAVKKLAGLIKKEYIHQSTAANISEKKRQNVIQAFNYLNGN